ncbi:MAG: beta-galactosidase [Butyrivibrio sp.]|jgi:beta-galactosidase|nr:beta-galactosidase [Butyrivibrio sp.]
MAGELIKDRLIHGGDYNPDQWLEYPEILKADIAYMKEAKINCVTLGVFAWAKLEPEEGRYDFEWLSEIMDRLYANGIYTILATPTGAVPHWMSEKYEEVRKMSGSGICRLHGQRHNFCYSSPVMRQKTREMDQALSARFGRHPGLIAWHISNEYGGDNDGIGCHCPYCEASFRKWLRNRYGSLEELNRAWWTTFWSNTYTDWGQIHSPSDNGEHTMHGLKLDWKRFISDQMLDFCKEEIAAVRTGSTAPALCNFMGAFKPLDYFRWAKELDLVSLDNYPFWHFAENESEMAMRASFLHTLTRSLKKQPYLMMESTPSVVNWAPRNSLKRPGMHELSSLQAIAYGSDSVQYFQWRKSRGGAEKYHGAVIDHKNGDNTRVFRDVSRLGARLEQISERVKGTCNRPRAAIVFDWENWWAADDAMAVVQPFDYLGRWMDYYRVFWEKGIDVDIVDMDDSLENYALVIAPVNYMYRGKYAGNVRGYVENGGVYVTTYWSGEVNESDLCFMDHHPLSDVLGIRTEETDVRPEHMDNQISYEGKSYEIKDLCALVHAEGAEVLATYQKDFYAGYPALTVNRYGKGKAYFIASENSVFFLRDFYDRLFQETQIICTFDACLPEGVAVSERKGAAESDSVWFIMNFNADVAEMTVHRAYQNIETEDEINGTVQLLPYQCLILTIPQRERKQK